MNASDISFYFQPVENISFIEGALSNEISIHKENDFPELERNSIALIYCPEFRGYEEISEKLFDDGFRYHFYSLFAGVNWNRKILDLGNIIIGKSLEDSQYAVAQVVSVLVKRDIIPIIIGGTQDLINSIYRGYEDLEQSVNVVSIDSKIDMGSIDSPIEKDGFLSQLLTQLPCHLFNYSVIGLQFPYVKKSELELFDRLYFDYLRLGELNHDIKRAEPLLRNSDIVSIDLQSLKCTDFKGDYYHSPNGFYSEQLCQIAKYAGISDKLSSFSILNFIPGNLNLVSHALVAELIWYFIDGVSERIGDFPKCSKKDYTKFIVQMNQFDHDVVFYKSNKSERWWMEVPYQGDNENKYLRHHLVPCNYEDYLNAAENEMPDLWWKTYQKLK